MLDITDKGYQPSLQEMSNYMQFPLFDELCETMEKEFGARYEIMFSGDKVLWGWNIRFCKSGRTLLRLYPDHERFQVLFVVGRREVEKVEQQLPDLSAEIQQIYRDTKEGMGQRWLLIPITEKNEVYDDLLKMVAIRRNS